MLFLSNTSYPFLEVDLDQATMIIIAAAQQSRFFEEISKNLSFWGGLAEVCALIGFTVGVIGYLLNRIGILHVLSWVLAMILLFVAPLNALQDGERNSDTLFFTALTPTDYEWAKQPYKTHHPRTKTDSDRRDAPKKPKTPLDDIKEIEQIKKGRPLYIFSPQLALIDTFNKIRAAIGGSFVNSESGYRAPLDEFSSRNKSSLKPLASFSRMMFGNIEGGTYSALLPMLLTFIMVIMIVCTPFILMLALMLPHWGPSLLLLTVGGVVYVKTVEILFAMVHGILGLFINIGPSSQMASTNPINEIILGLGYFLALIASIWLIFKARHTGKSLHSLMHDFISESRTTGRQIQQNTAANLAQGITSRSLKGANLIAPGNSQQALMAPMQRLTNTTTSSEVLYSKAAAQQTAVRWHANKNSADTAEQQDHLIEKAYQKVREDALRNAQEAGVSKQASMPRAATAAAGQKQESNEPALTKIAKIFGGKTPEELSKGYHTATQLFSTGALSMRTDDENKLRIEVNLSLEIMETLSPEAQSAVNKLQNDGMITRIIANGTPCFVIDE